jgi:hypothetical protein
MLGSKGILTPMIHGLLRISCKQETHDLLTLVSYIIIKYKRCLQNPQPEFRKIVVKYYEKVIL